MPMRDAFVLRIGSDSDPKQLRFVGSIEEVDTGRERRFRSTDELLSFVASCVEEARRRDRGDAGDVRDRP
jgi:hypothetical protein